MVGFFFVAKHVYRVQILDIMQVNLLLCQSQNLPVESMQMLVFYWIYFDVFVSIEIARLI